MKNIVIFGATGNTGSYFTLFAKEYFKERYNVIAVGRKKTQFFTKYNIPYYSVDISKQNEFLYIRDTFNSLSSNKREFMEKIKQLCENEIIGINNIIVNEIKMNSQLANNVKV